MPVSGNDEPKVKPLAWHSSNSIVGVPIKKRKFLLVQPSSPPSQTSSSLPVEADPSQNEHSNSKPESFSANAGDAMEIPGIADTEMGSFKEKKGDNSPDVNVNMISGNANIPRFNIQEQIASGYGVEVGGKGTLLLADRSAFQIPGNTELQLAPNEAIAIPIGEELNCEGKFKRDDKSNLSSTAGNTELLLAPKELFVPDLEGQNSQGGCEVKEKLDSYSLNLPLNKGQLNVENKCNDTQSNVKHSHLHANRSNWDLNTPMDTWGGLTNDVATANDVGGVYGVDGTGILGMCASEMVIREPKGTHIASGKQIFDESKHRSNFPSLYSRPDQQCKAEDLLSLCLSPSVRQSSFSQKHSSPPSKLESERKLSNLSLSETLVPPASNLSLSGGKIVKSEPCDKGSNQSFKLVKDGSLKLVDHGIVKSEPVERYDQESLRPSNICNLKLVGHNPVKSEPVSEGNQETLKTVERGISTQLELPTCSEEVPMSVEALERLESPTCTKVIPIKGEESHSLKFPTCSMEFPKNGKALIHSDSVSCTNVLPVTGEISQKACEIVDRVASDKVSESADPDDKESKVVDGTLDILKTECQDGVNPNLLRLKPMNDSRMNSFVNSELAGDDKDKICLFTDMLEVSYDTDYESDGDHAVGGAMDMDDKQHGDEDDDYEDGEVREPLVHTTVEGDSCEKREEECVNSGESTNRDAEVSALPGDDCVTTSLDVENKDINIENPGETVLCSGECDSVVLNEKNDQAISKVACLQESLTTEVQTIKSDKKRPIKVTRRKPLNRSGGEDGPKGGFKTESISDPMPSANQGTVTSNGQGDEGSQKDNVKVTDPGKTSHLIFAKADPSLNDDEAAKDANSRSNQSRIINLPRASNDSFSVGSRHIPIRSFPPRTERERFTDVGFRGEKLHPRGSRNEWYMDRSRKYGREWNQDQPVGNSGKNFMHGRGRIGGGRGRIGGGWDSDGGFAPGQYNGSTGLRFPRPKNASAGVSGKFECSTVTPDGTIIGTGRGGRKPLNDGLSSFRHPPSRRQSFGVRGVQMFRRPPRDISPDRCFDGSGPELVGVRHEDKFMRGLPDDMMDRVFSPPQPEYELVDDLFVRGDGNFSPIQRRGSLNVPQIHSKSPQRSRTRSPGPWSSPRRSADEFDVDLELIHCRSPPIFRMEKIRSPHRRPCFAEEMVARRHSSAHYISRPSNDLRDMGSAREHEHPRTFIPNRSPSGRFLPRSTRRFDMVDPRPRTQNDECFDGPVHSDRFHEFEGDGGVDERRNGSERRGPVRSFRSPYNDPDLENFRYDVEDSTRPHRFGPGADTEFHEGDSLREREFGRRIKNRSGNAPRRATSVEEQEENYMHVGHPWPDTGFDDISRVKRRRF